MANIHRLIVLFFLSFLSFSALALIPPKSEQKWYNSSYKNYIDSYQSCITDFSGRSSIYHYTKVKSSSFIDGKTVVTVEGLLQKNNEVVITYTCTQGGPYTCPANSSLVDGGCTCNEGYEEKNGQCELIENQCSEGETSSFQIPIGWGVYYPGSSGSIAVDGGGSITPKTVNSPPSSICSGGCNYSFIEQEDNYVNFDYSSGTGAYRIDSFSKYEASGSTCNQESDLSQNSGSPPSCSGVVGTFNGRQYCASNPTDPTDPGDGGSTGGDGGSTGGDGGSTGGGGGSTGGGGGSTGGGGGSTGGGGGSTGGGGGSTGGGGGSTGGEDEDEESEFGGSCDSGFTCEGDAILCAIAKKQHDNTCKLSEDNQESALYDKSKKKKEEKVTDDLETNITREFSSVNSSPRFSYSSCVQDLNITVWGTSVEIPISKICPWLSNLGYVLVAVAWIMAAAIVMRGR